MYPRDGIAGGLRWHMEHVCFLQWARGIEARFPCEGELGTELCFPNIHLVGLWKRQSLWLGRLDGRPSMLHSSCVQLGSRVLSLFVSNLSTFLQGSQPAQWQVLHTHLCDSLALTSMCTVVGLYGSGAGRPHLFSLPC